MAADQTSWDDVLQEGLGDLGELLYKIYVQDMLLYGAFVWYVPDVGRLEHKPIGEE